MRQHRNPDEAISSTQGIASGDASTTEQTGTVPPLSAERPRNDITGNWSDYETMMQEKFGKDLTPHRVKYER